jgi:dolichyl-phosphate beta-glucosyltransferase
MSKQTIVLGIIKVVQMENNILLIIPVYNEGLRWSQEYFLDLCSTKSDITHFLFVDDGSSDDSLLKIDDFSKMHPNVSWLGLASNMGKAEAIRLGFHYAINNGFVGAGFLDADGAFLASDVHRIAAVFKKKVLIESTFLAVFSSRIAISGRKIKWSKHRHFLGRVVSKFISFCTPDCPWDTQAGLKFFRVGQSDFQLCLAERFHTKWLFEIEILQRYYVQEGTHMPVWEEPVMSWVDIRGSKIGYRGYGTILSELGHILINRLRLRLGGK